MSGLPCLTDLFSRLIFCTVPLPPSVVYLLRRRQTITNGHKCSGKWKQSAENRRKHIGRPAGLFCPSSSRSCASSRLHCCRIHEFQASVSGARLRFRRSTRADPRGRARGRRGRRASRDLQSRAVSSHFGDLVLPLGTPASSSPIHSFVVPTPRIGPIHSPLTRWRARARPRVIADGVLRVPVIARNLFIYP